MCVCCLVAKPCPTLLLSHGLEPRQVLCPWDFPGKNTGLGCNFLLQGIFPTQGSNPHLLHLQKCSLELSHQGSPNTCVYFQFILIIHILLVGGAAISATFLIQKCCFTRLKSKNKAEEGTRMKMLWSYHSKYFIV